MTVSKPKGSTLTALSLFLILTFSSFFMLMNSLLKDEGYFIFKVILAPIVLAIGLLVLSRLLAAVKVVKLGNNAIEVLYPITRVRFKIPVADILGWREEVVKTKNGDYREVKVLYEKKKILKLSNKENTEYDKVVSYLRKKVKVAKN